MSLLAIEPDELGATKYNQSTYLSTPTRTRLNKICLLEKDENNVKWLCLFNGSGMWLASCL